VWVSPGCRGTPSRTRKTAVPSWMQKVEDPEFRREKWESSVLGERRENEREWERPIARWARSVEVRYVPTKTGVSDTSRTKCDREMCDKARSEIPFGVDMHGACSTSPDVQAGPFPVRNGLLDQDSARIRQGPSTTRFACESVTGRTMSAGKRLRIYYSPPPASSSGDASGKAYGTPAFRYSCLCPGEGDRRWPQVCGQGMGPFRPGGVAVVLLTRTRDSCLSSRCD